MTDTDSPLRVRDASPVAFLPAAVLLVAVTLAMTADILVGLALQAIFAAFVVGVLLVGLSQVLGVLGGVSQSTARSSLAAGVMLLVASVLLYLVFGCVFGCPG